MFREANLATGVEAVASPSCKSAPRPQEKSSVSGGSFVASSEIDSVLDNSCAASCGRSRTLLDRGAVSVRFNGGAGGVGCVAARCRGLPSRAAAAISARSRIDGRLRISSSPSRTDCMAWRPASESCRRPCADDMRSSRAMTTSSSGPPWSFAEGPPEPGGLRVRAWPSNRSMLVALRVKGVWEAISSQSLVRAQRLKTRIPLWALSAMREGSY
mmetsp:Transcript_12091/g.36185  ORF Transcript_12091/g.36185 Transcript_12091/m.36185 type:complete len:214 (+) Transcript_12091:3666-4307(+)